MNTKKTKSMPESKCDICGCVCDTEIIDAPTRQGPWAHMCVKCFKTNGREPATKFVKVAPAEKLAADEMRKRIRDHARSLSEEELEEMVSDSIVPTACPDGCEVEPDGKCCHGYPSPLTVLGII